MSNPLLAHSLLFNSAEGSRGWYAGCGDGTSVAIQDRMIDQMDRAGSDTICLNVMNEDLSSPFKGAYMASDLDQFKVDLFWNFVIRLKCRGKKVVIVFFDGDEGSFTRTDAKYEFHRRMDKHAEFMALVTKATRCLVDGYCIGIETNRYASIEIVEQAIALTKLYAVRTAIDGSVFHIPVFSHEQNVSWNDNGPYLRRRVPINADIAGFETSNHPFKGDDVSVSDMVREVTCLYERSGKQVWVMESNSKKSERAKEQNRALAELPFVVGIDGIL